MKSVPATAILVVDSQKNIRRRVENHLVKAGYRIIAVEAVSDLLARARAEQVSMVLLHCMPPAEQVLSMIRSFKKDAHGKRVLVMMYSKQCTQPTQVVAALESGVDEYIAFPFDWKVFCARIKALLRRASFQTAQPRWITYKNIKVNPDAHIAQVDNKQVSLTPKEFGLLYQFIEKQGTVLDRAYLMESIWEYSYFGTTRTVDKHVENLRNKLGKTGKNILTVERVGYKLE